MQITSENIFYIRSQPLVHMPGFFNWLVKSVLPFDIDSAARLLDAMGLPTDATVAVIDGNYQWNVEEDQKTVRLVTYH